MTPWFIATETFTRRYGEGWRKYVEWSGLTQLEELVSLDVILCQPILDEIKPEYWPHIVNEHHIGRYFVDLEFLKRVVEGVAEMNLLCLLRNPPVEPVQPPVEGFKFVGYDLVDELSGVSALCNCGGGFPEVFANSELSRFGLFDEFSRGVEVQRLLRSHYPNETHADCDLWAIFRATD